MLASGMSSGGLLMVEYTSRNWFSPATAAGAASEVFTHDAPS